jgi:hypothetical protein
MIKKYFLSFVEEGIANPDYEGYVAGRVEVSIDNESYAVEEIRFLTDKQEDFYEFMGVWDFQYVNEGQLVEIRDTIKEKYMEVKDDIQG